MADQTGTGSPQGASAPPDIQEVSDEQAQAELVETQLQRAQATGVESNTHDMSALSHP